MTETTEQKPLDPVPGSIEFHVVWKEGHTPEERKEAEEAIHVLNQGLIDDPSDFPAAIQTLTINRLPL